MKKILFLLLITISGYSQTLQNPIFGTVTIKNSATVTTTPALTTTEATGLQKKINPADLPLSDPTKTYIDSKIPADYSKIVYVNATNPNSATIFDLNNPPTVNDNLLKTDVNNLYIANDASTWVYNSGSAAYVTKIVSSATSNFYLTGTTTDAGNSKTAHITRTGNVGSSSFIKNVAAVNNTYASVVNNTLVIGARGMGLTPAIMARTNSPTVTAMHLTTMQSSDVARTAEDDMSFRNGYEAGGDAVLGYSTAGSAFGFYNGSFENLNIFRNGNVNINPPATITPVNAGYRLDVGGTARIQGLLTTTDIMSTGVVTTNTRFNATTPYTSSQVGTAGVSVQISPRTITNSATASGGTVAQHVNNGFLIPTFSATSTGVTYTNASNVFIDGAPTAGTNVSITNPWSFYVNSGKSYFGGNVSFAGTVSGVTKSMVGLGSVDNTSDVNKPVSTATQTALDLKANLASPALTGNPTAPTPTAGDNDTTIPTTAFVTGAIATAVVTARPYKVYTVVMNQTTTSAPTIVITFENTLGGSIVWTRNGVGDYRGTLTGVFTSLKTVAFTSLAGAVSMTPLFINGERVSNNEIRITTYNGMTPTDGLMTNAIIEFRVYN